MRSSADPMRAIVDALQRGIVLTRERIAEALEDAVTRGRITRQDAEELTATLVGIGRAQAQELLRAARLTRETEAAEPKKPAASRKKPAAAKKKPAAKKPAAAKKKPAAAKKKPAAKRPRRAGG